VLDYCFPCFLWEVRIRFACQDPQRIGKIIWALSFFLAALVELNFMSMVVTHRSETLQ
jgi:hypothetical protein